MFGEYLGMFGDAFGNLFLDVLLPRGCLGRGGGGYYGIVR